MRTPKNTQPKVWDRDQLQSVRLMLGTDGWRLFEDYAMMRLEAHKMSLPSLVEEGSPRAASVAGAIKELRMLFENVHEAFDRDAAKRVKELRALEQAKIEEKNS